MRSKFAKIVVTFERRDDGGLRAYSDDVPGFVLSHSDAEAVLADIKPALETILSAMLDGPVIVEPLPGIAEEIKQTGPSDQLPPVRAHRVSREYVSQLVAA